MPTFIRMERISIGILTVPPTPGHAQAIRTNGPGYPIDDGVVERSRSGAIPLGPVTPDDVQVAS